MRTVRRRRQRKQRRGRIKKRQKGGMLPLAAVVPAIIAAGKAVGLGAAGAAGAAAGFGTKKPRSHDPKTEKVNKNGCLLLFLH